MVLEVAITATQIPIMTAHQLVRVSSVAVHHHLRLLIRPVATAERRDDRAIRKCLRFFFL